MPSRRPETPPSAAPSTAPLAAPDSPRVNTKALLILVTAIVMIALVGWMVVISGKRKQSFATRELVRARAIAEQGNLPLAASELQRVIDNFSGTEASQEAVISLNQVRMINGQSDLALISLRQFIGSNPAPKYLAPAHGLLAAAQENAGEPAAAAASYEAAAAAADLDFLKAEYLVDASRAYRAAGDSAKAEAAVRKVVADYAESPSVTEAKVRLAEMTKGKM